MSKPLDALNKEAYQAGIKKGQVLKTEHEARLSKCKNPLSRFAEKSRYACSIADGILRLSYEYGKKAAVLATEEGKQECSMPSSCPPSSQSLN